MHKRKPWTRLFLGALFLLMMAVPAWAQIDPIASNVVSAGGTVLMTPSGLAPGLPVGGDIIVNVIDVTGALVVGLTAADFEIDGMVPPNVSDAFFPAIPAHNVPPGSFAVIGPGRYQIRGRFLAGGNANGLLVKVRGVFIITGTPTPHRAVSPDINADGVVNLGDIALFAAMLFGPYDPRGDFNFNGIINLADVAIMASYIGDTYPPGGILDPVD